VVDTNGLTAEAVRELVLEALEAATRVPDSRH